MKINPYLNFAGQTEEAFNFYRSVFGTEFIMLSRFKDAAGMPGCEQMSEAEQNKVLHVALPIGNGNILMASDTMENMGPQLSTGNNFSICISVDSKDEADALFEKLSHGARIIMPLQDMFWGDYYGMLSDKFGIQWMISFNPNQRP